MVKGRETMGGHRGNESEGDEGVRQKFGLVGRWILHVQLQKQWEK